MSFAAGCSLSPDARQALDDATQVVATGLKGMAPNLSFLFVTPAHAAEFADLVADAVVATRSRHLLACVAESVIAGDREIESGPALSLWSAVLPDAKVESFHVSFERTPDGPICSGLPEAPADTADIRAILLLGDPYTCAVDTLIERLADDYPRVPLIGGMASGASAPGETLLSWNGDVINQGAVGVVLKGGPQVHSVVSQGCRPIGSTFVVTKAERNVMFELGGKPALARLEETYGSLPERDRELIRQGVHLGLVMDEHKPNFSRGDFLISNVLGADRESGAIAVGNFVRLGQTVQFHVRDADTADEDLRHMLGHHESKHPAGALLFSCNGRGTRLFDTPHHDASVLRELCGELPVAGFFAQGELGPVGGRNYIHGFTASVALFDAST